MGYFIAWIVMTGVLMLVFNEEDKRHGW